MQFVKVCTLEVHNLLFLEVMDKRNEICETCELKK
jgi:hypothetical protein